MRLLIFVLLLWKISPVWSQAGAPLPKMPPSFSKQAIPGTSSAAYLPKNFVWEPVSFSEDSSEVRVGSSRFEGGYEFGLIYVDFKTPFPGNDAQREELLVSYLDFLKTAYKAKASAGYGRGHRLKADSSVLGVIDYWSFEDQSTSSIKGWVGHEFLAVYMINYTTEVNYGIRELYFEGLRPPVKKP